VARTDSDWAYASSAPAGPSIALTKAGVALG